MLTAISPVDGRYASKTSVLQDYFSEYALIRYRVRVEIVYFQKLCQSGIPSLQAIDADALSDIWKNFTEQDALRIKEIEAVTNHDVKAVEYFLREKFEARGLGAHVEFIHFGLTSQDINNTAVPLSQMEAFRDHLVPVLEGLIERLIELSVEWKDIPMLARTHGQPASLPAWGKNSWSLSSVYKNSW